MTYSRSNLIDYTVPLFWAGARHPSRRNLFWSCWFHLSGFAEWEIVLWLAVPNGWFSLQKRGEAFENPKNFRFRRKLCMLVLILTSHDGMSKAWCGPASLLASAGYLPLLCLCSTFLTEFFFIYPQKDCFVQIIIVLKQLHLGEEEEKPRYV